MSWPLGLILFLPWVLDLAAGRGVLATLFGALLWGSALSLAFIRERSREPLFRKKVGLLISLISGAWLCYWALSFSSLPPTLLTGRAPLRVLVLTHAALLAAGAGMMLVLAFSSGLWLLQDFLLRKGSWARRASHWRLPSLETLTKACRLSNQMAALSWGLGLGLAILATIVYWPREASDPAHYTWAWIRDPKVLITALLWGLLLVGLKLDGTFLFVQRWRYRLYMIFSLSFIAFFAWFMSADTSAIHDRVEWFLR